MPYKKNYRRNNAKSKSLKELSRKVDKISRVTKPEIKEIYTNMTSTSIDYDGNLTNFSNILQDVTDESRVGNKVQSLKLDLRAVLTATGVDSSVVRVIFFKDKQNLITLPVNILRYAGTPQAVNSPYADDTRNAFSILSDRTYKVVPNASNDKVSFHLLKSLNFPSLWDDAGTQIGNSIKVLFVSDHAGTSSNKPLVAMAGRYLYSDC